MSTSVFADTFSPEVGATVRLPENIGRIDTERDTESASFGETFKISVVGTGDTERYIVLKTDIKGRADIEDGSQILATDPIHGHLWYALSEDEYGGSL
jgi:hypothetical protein